GSVGDRAKTEYSITPAGRRALREWLESPCAPIALDAEVLVRVFFARAGTPESLARAVSEARAVADDIQSIGRVVAEEFVAGRAPHQAQPHLNAIVFDFLWSWADQIRQWADRWEPEIRAWRDTDAAEP